MRWRWFVAGAVCFPVVLCAIGGIVLTARQDGFSARARPAAWEALIGRAARRAAIPSDARLRTNPVSDSAAVEAEARAHWADHCASCHANDGSGNVSLGKQMYPQAPDMRQPRTQEMTDGELFYIIENGVRLTGMPAWGAPGRDESDSWKLVHFIRRLPRLTAAEIQEMEKLNPKGPDELKEEQEEEQFLNGAKPNENAEHVHHH